MTWIKTKPPGHPDVAEAFRDALSTYPAEYAPARRSERQVPAPVMEDNIVLSHSLLPEVMRRMLGGLGAMMDPKLPLSRREHELIAAAVSSINDCFY